MKMLHVLKNAIFPNSYYLEYDPLLWLNYLPFPFPVLITTRFPIKMAVSLIVTAAL